MKGKALMRKALLLIAILCIVAGFSLYIIDAKPVSERVFPDYTGGTPLPSDDIQSSFQKSTACAAVPCLTTLPKTDEISWKLVWADEFEKSNVDRSYTSCNSGDG